MLVTPLAARMGDIAHHFKAEGGRVDPLDVSVKASEDPGSFSDHLLLRFFLAGALVLALAGLYAVTHTQESRFVNGCAERFERVPDITVEEGRVWCTKFWQFDAVGCDNLSDRQRAANNFCMDDRA